MTLKAPKLALRERICVLFILLIFILLITINLCSVHVTNEDRLVAHTINCINVTFEGQLLNPGTYQVKKGITLEEALSLAELTAEADISLLNKSITLMSDQIIRIKSIAKATVYVEGAVKKRGKFDVPVSYTVEDVLKKAELSANANTEALGDMQREIRAGEVIKVDFINIGKL